MGDTVARLGRGSATLAERIQAERARLFVGRDAEQAAFARFAAPDDPLAAWFVVGAGGMGKSALLRRFHELAPEHGLTPAFVDARRFSPNPPEARHALARAAGTDSLEAFCADHARVLLLIDSFEYWQPLESWLREDFLPGLPETLKMVFAGRKEPGVEWRTDEGWHALMRITHLEGLDEADSVDYLTRRGLEGRGRDQLLRFAAGNPLALAMGADSVLAGRSVATFDTESSASDAIPILVESFTQEAENDAQRQALDACAIARELNEGLLAHILGRDDVAELYEWLRGLSCVEQGEAGIFPHDLVRDALMREMPRRHPGRYEVFAAAAVDWTVRHIAARSLSWQEAARLAADGIYVLRGLPMVDEIFRARGTRALYLDGVAREDWSTLYEMTRRHEGDESSRWLEFWCRRFPDAVHVIRDTQGAACGFFLKLDMEALAVADRDADPLTRKLWAFLEADLGLHPGDHVPFVRHWVTEDYALTQSPEKTQILMAVNSYNLIAGNLRATAQVFVDNPAWVALAEGLGVRSVPGSDTRIGELTWRIYYFDWQRESPPRYYRQFVDRVIGFQRALRGESVPEPPPGGPDEAEFKAAVASALKTFHEPARLVDNPLLGASLVRSRTDGAADERARIRVLRRQIEDAAETLGVHGEAGARQGRILRRAYLTPARSQKEAAAALNMGYSTFRRHLANAREALAAELWRREKASR